MSTATGSRSGSRMAVELQSGSRKARGHDDSDGLLSFQSHTKNNSYRHRSSCKMSFAFEGSADLIMDDFEYGYDLNLVLIFG